ncbi:hypothetical protein AB4072_00915 [Microvirga sp. 2MCAF38]|uniref:hypothetical protein n=1 Tax=Microvirga sp. 2MCAF38 TaxID=3232989 RepID=UPI003F98F40F
MLSGYINSATGPVIGQWHFKGRRLFGWASTLAGAGEPAVLDLRVMKKRKALVCDIFWAGDLPAQISHRFVGFEYNIEDALLREHDQIPVQLVIGKKDFASPVVIVPTLSFNTTQLHIDTISSGSIEGWAWSPFGNGDEPVYLDIDKKRFSVWPTEFRRDLYEAGFANGACSFKLNLRQSGTPLSAKTIRATFMDASKEFTIGRRESAFEKIENISLVKLAQPSVIPQPRYLITL